MQISPHKGKRRIVMVSLGVLMTFGALFTTTSGSAQDLSPKQIERQLKDANAAFEQGNYEGARDGYLQVLAVAEKKVPTTYYRLGVCYERLDNYAKSIEAYRRYITLNPNGSRLELAGIEITRLERKLAASETAALEIKTTPPGFKVHIGGPSGTFHGLTPTKIGLKPGPVTVYLSRDGYATETHKMEIQAGQISHLSASPDPAEAFLKIESKPPGAVVRLLEHPDGVIGNTPLVHQLKPGYYTVFVTIDKYQSRTERIKVANNETVQRSYTMTPLRLKNGGSDDGPVIDPLEARRTSGWGWGLTITGGVLALGAGGLWFWTNDTIETVNDYDIQDPNNSRSELEDLEDRVPLLQTATWVTGGIAAASVTTGLVLILIDNSDQARSGMIGDLYMAPIDDGGMVTWQGQF